MSGEDTYYTGAVDGDAGVDGNDNGQASAIGAGDASPGDADAGEEDSDASADDVDAEDVGEDTGAGGHDGARQLTKSGRRAAAATHKERWEDKYRALLAFKREHGHCHPPRTHALVGSWVKNQRRHYHIGKLAEGRRARLEAIGFAWRIEDVRWEERFAELAAHRRRAGGDRDPPQWKTLGSWTRKQRERRVEGDLSEEQVARLEGIGFEWAPAPEDNGAGASGGEGTAGGVARGGGRGRKKSAEKEATKKAGEPRDSQAATRAAIKDLSSQMAEMKEALMRELRTPKATAERHASPRAETETRKAHAEERAQMQRSHRAKVEELSNEIAKMKRSHREETSKLRASNQELLGRNAILKRDRDEERRKFAAELTKAREELKRARAEMTLLRNRSKAPGRDL